MERTDTDLDEPEGAARAALGGGGDQASGPRRPQVHDAAAATARPHLRPHLGSLSRNVSAPAVLVERAVEAHGYSAALRLQGVALVNTGTNKFSSLMFYTESYLQK